MSNLTIREAKLSDAGRVAEIHIKTWQFAYKGQMPESFLAGLSVKARKTAWEKALANPHPKEKVFVAEVDGELVGFCGLGANRDKDATEDTGELYAIYIDPDHMGTGAGSTLMATGLAYLKEAGFNSATLWVLSTNTKTREFYEHKGWNVDGKSKVETRQDFELHETRYSISLK